MNMDDFPCKCGHVKAAHFWDDVGVINGSCHLTKSCKINNTSFADEYIDNCVKYIPNNLVYLEQKAKEAKI